MSRVRADIAQGATFVELFFDLVFVYAVTQLTAFVVHDLSWAGVGKTALLFWLVWWAWTQFTWTLNLADTEHAWVRLPTLAATAIAFFMAQAVPDAFGSAGAWFALAYVAVRLIGLWVQLWVMGDDQRGSVLTWIGFSSIGLVLVVVGAFVSPDIRIWFWGAAVVADVLAAVNAGSRVWILEPGHFAERHGLIVIIALGESLIATGVATSEVERDLLFAVAAGGAVVITCALWWTYFGSCHRAMEHMMSEQSDRSRGGFARDVFSFWHAPIVAGVIGVAVAFEEAIAHAGDPLSDGGALALTIGTALFVGGLGAAARRAGIRGAAWPRITLAALVLALTPLVGEVSGATALWALAVLVVGVDVVEFRFRPAETA